MFTSLKAVAYRVSDLDRAKQWYKAILCREPVIDSPLGVFFPVGESVLSLMPAGNSAPGAGQQVLAYWGVEDIEAARQQLLAAGAAPRGEVITGPLGTRSATVVDPFGNIVGIASRAPKTKKETLAEKPSESALGVALFRAMATREAREEIRGMDFLAERFLPGEFRNIVDNPAGREWVKSQAPGSYEYFLARTAFFDAVVRDALSANLPQLVFLGAGYDSRPYRFHNLIEGTRIFEIDLESTQRRKQQLLAQADIPVPAAVTFISLDFSRDSLSQALGRAGFDKTQRTLYVWEGVMYYLPPATVDETLEFVRRNSPAGSVLCFDYQVDAPDMASRYGVAESQRMMRERYQFEPIQTRIAEGTIQSFLMEHGFSVAEHLTPEEMEKKYLTLRDGSTAGKVLALHSLVRATVNA